MGGDDKRMITSQKLGCQFVTDLVRFFRRYLARLKGLAQLISDDFVTMCSSSRSQILISGKKEFCIRCLRGTGICSNQLSAIGLLWIFDIIDSCLQALAYGFAFVIMHRNDPGCCHTFLHKKKSGDL